MHHKTELSYGKGNKTNIFNIKNKLFLHRYFYWHLRPLFFFFFFKTTFINIILFHVVLADTELEL